MSFLRLPRSNAIRMLARGAHSGAKPQIKTGASLPSSAGLKDLEGKPFGDLNHPGAGKRIIVGVPGAFTPSCSSQVPGYLEAYEKFKSKGINEIYVVAVNDSFVMKAWKEKLAGSKGTNVKFLSDDKADFVSELGLAFDATSGLGGHRAKRFAMVVDGEGKITKLVVEEVPSDVKVTAADALLKDV